MYKKIVRNFSFKSPYIDELQTFNRKVNIKQTISEKRNLQHFLENQVKDGKLRTTIQRTTQYDNEFSKFLKDYQEKNKDSPTILDLSHYTKDNDSFNKSTEKRKEELIMLEEFRKRRMEANKLASREDQQKLLNDIDDMEDEGGEADEESKNDATLENWDQIKKIGQYKFQRDDFMTFVISQDVTTLVTKLNRINHFRSLIFAGNANGVIGYGKGKGNDFEEAMKNAESNLKKNLIAIDLDHFCTLPIPIKDRYNGFELRLFPNKGMNAWGSPMIGHLLLLTGITDCSFKCIFRNLNPYAAIMTYFKIVTQIKTPRQMSETKGVKIYRESWGKPILMDKVHTSDTLL